MASASGASAEGGSSTESSSGKSSDKSMPADVSGGKTGAAPPVGDSNRSYASNNGGKDSDQSSSSTPNSNKSGPPVAQLASLSSPVNPGGNNGGTPGAGSAPYSLTPSGGDLGGQGNPSVTPNPNAGAGDVQRSLQQNYGNLIPTAGSGGLQAPPTTGNSSGSPAITPPVSSPNIGGKDSPKDQPPPPRGRSV
jgi:hypothetical protein